MRDLSLLIVDDDELVLQAIRIAVTPTWRTTTVVGTEPIPHHPYHAALVDMHLSGRVEVAEGLGVIKSLRARDPHIEIVAMSADLDRDLMEMCLKSGASRFLAKPLHPDELKLTLDKIEELCLLQGALARAGRKVKPWVGSTPAARAVHKAVAGLKGEKGPILIEGESGTGKEIVANLLHAQYDDSPFVAINVAAIPENLFESEFFGHVRGAFTGADQNKMGLAEASHGGDLFLDEIEALPMGQQAKLLRFLESGEIRRVGAKDSVQVQARVIAATNRNLQQLVNEGKFREDLLWRLSGKKVLLPPLRDRRDDIPELCQYFLNLDRARKKSFDPDAMTTLQNYSWPGNVRELQRVIEQILLKSPLPVIRKEDVLAALQTPPGDSPIAQMDFSLGLPELVNRFEADAISRCLEKYHDIDEVARVLKISRSSLYKKIKDHNIEWKTS